MARINIEEVWWSSARRAKLIGLFKGDVRLADGLTFHAWRIAQDYAKSNFLIPLEDFSCLQDSQYLFECNLAVLCVVGDDGNPRKIGEVSKQTPSKDEHDVTKVQQASTNLYVYVSGTKDHHGWLVKRRQNGSKGGQKSATRGRDARGRLGSDPSKHQANPSKHQASSSTSSSTSISIKEESIGTALKPVAGKQLPPEGMSEFIGVYVKAFQKRYGNESRPDLRGKVQGQIKVFLKDTSLDRAINLIEVYLQMDNDWFKTKGHDFGTFVENLNPISIALDTGKDQRKDPFGFLNQ